MKSILPDDILDDMKKNFIYKMIYETITLLIPLVTMPYISRVLNADGIGRYSFSYSVISYFLLFGALGTVGYGTREIARTRDDRKAYTKLFVEIELVSMISCGGCLAIWAFVILAGGEYRLFYLALTPFLAGTMFDISWFYTGLEKIKLIVLGNSAVRILGVVLTFVLVKHREDVIIYCIITSLTFLVSNLSVWIFLPRLLDRISLGGLEIRRHFHETFIYFVPSIAISLYTVLDKTLIGIITGDPYQNGYYEQAAYVVAAANVLVFAVLNAVSSARMSYLFSKEAFDEIKVRLLDSIDFILLMGFGAVFGLLGITHNFVPVFFGEEYAPVEPLIYLRLPLILIIGISNCLCAQYFTPAGKKAKSAKYIVTGAICNIVLNVFFIPVWKALGAVVASLIAEMLITVLHLRNCEGYLRPGDITERVPKRLAAGVLMSAIVWCAGRLPFGGIADLIIQFVLGVLVYGTILLLFGDKLAVRIKNMILRGFSNALKCDRMDT